MRIQNVTTNYQNNKQKFGVAVKGPLETVKELSNRTGMGIFGLDGFVKAASKVPHDLLSEADAKTLISTYPNTYLMRTDINQIFTKGMQDDSTTNNGSIGAMINETRNICDKAIELVPAKVKEVFAKYNLGRPSDQLAPIAQREAALTELGILPGMYNKKLDLPFTNI